MDSVCEHGIGKGLFMTMDLRHDRGETWLKTILLCQIKEQILFYLLLFVRFGWIHCALSKLRIREGIVNSAWFVDSNGKTKFHQMLRTRVFFSDVWKGDLKWLVYKGRWQIVFSFSFFMERTVYKILNTLLWNIS